MKKYFLLILMNVFLLTGCSSASDEKDPYIVIKPDTKENPTPVSPMKGICIFVGQAETFTDADWQTLANSPLTDFIIIPREAAAYVANEAGYKSQLTPFMVNVINQIVTPKVSQTVIGPEMELNWKAVPPNNYADFLGRYNEYVSSYIEYKGTYPIIFWIGMEPFKMCSMVVLTHFFSNYQKTNYSK